MVTSHIDEGILQLLYPKGKKTWRTVSSIRIFAAMSILKEGFGYSNEEFFEKWEFCILPRRTLGPLRLDDVMPSLETYYLLWRRICDYYVAIGVNLLQLYFEQITNSSQIKELNNPESACTWTANSLEATSPPVQGTNLFTSDTDSEDSKAMRTVKERLIITYSGDRTKKDADNRKRGVARLKKTFESGIVKKESLNRRGYNKFLEITRDVGITINDEKVEEDVQWGGWKGYITNTDMSTKEVVRQYNELWVVERALRITKGKLEFYFTARRIETHICICFIAYKVHKELERIMKLMKFPMSVDKVLEIAKTIPTGTMRMPHNRTTQITLFLTDE